MSALLACSLFAFLAAPADAPEGDKASKAVEVVKDHLASKKPAPLSVTGAAYPKLFPHHAFVFVTYRTFPVAVALPDGYGAGNVLAVSDDKKIHRIADTKALESFFRSNLTKVENAVQAKDALDAWLNLSKEFRQDGMFKFEVLKKEFGGEDGKDLTVRGRAMVVQGGNGEIAATLVFADGKLTKVQETSNIRSGPRPICQATKLLDDDPIVRKMAEQDLIMMGRSAFPYLDEQRAKAEPALRQAIDAIRLAIEKNGW